MEIKYKKFTDTAKAPYQKYATDACWDLYADTEPFFDGKNIVYKTGIGMDIPKGFVGLLFPRSSVSKTDLILSNSVGIIDSGFIGEITIKFKFISDKDIYKKGDRAGQIMIIRRPEIQFIEVEELEKSDRGEGGFGHTGKN